MRRMIASTFGMAVIGFLAGCGAGAKELPPDPNQVPPQVDTQKMMEDQMKKMQEGAAAAGRPAPDLQLPQQPQGQGK